MHKSIDIVAPAVCMDLTVLATAKMELGIPTLDTSKDAQIAILIKQASSVVSAYCDQVFGEETITETFWADTPSEWASSFMLSRNRVTNLVSVEIDGIVLDPSAYRMGADGHVHRINELGGGPCLWSWTIEAVITYTAGYVLLDALPYGVERATLNLIKDYYSGAGRDPRVRAEEIPGIRNVTYWVGGMGGQSGSLPPDVIALLAPYKRLAFA
jgi:hypothetical protein